MEFKTVTCSVTGALILVEIQRGKEIIKNRKHHMQIGVMAAYTKRIIEPARGIAQRNEKGYTKFFFSFLKLVLLK